MAGEMDEAERLKLRLQLHAEYAKEANAREAASSDNYDKAIMTYTTGALALSITFMSTVLKDTTHVKDMAHLKCAWILWVVSLVFTIVSFQVSVKAQRREAEKATIYYLDDKKEALSASNWWAFALLVLNLSAGLLFAAGAGAMMWFVWVNL